MKKAPWSFRVYRLGDYTSQLCGDYFKKNIKKLLLKIPIKSQWKVRPFLFMAQLEVTNRLH